MVVSEDLRMGVGGNLRWGHTSAGAARLRSRAEDEQDAGGGMGNGGRKWKREEGRKKK